MESNIGLLRLSDSTCVSWGTLVAVTLALRKDYPTRGLVLASGYYFPTARWDVWMMSGPAVPIFGDLLRYTVAPIISWAMLPGLIRKPMLAQQTPVVCCMVRARSSAVNGFLIMG